MSERIGNIPFDTKRADAATAGVHPHTRPAALSQATCAQCHKIAPVVDSCLSGTEARNIVS